MLDIINIESDPICRRDSTFLFSEMLISVTLTPLPTINIVRQAITAITPAESKMKWRNKENEYLLHSFQELLLLLTHRTSLELRFTMSQFKQHIYP